MDQEINKQIEDQLKTLPVPLQRAIALTPWRSTVIEVANNNALSSDQAKSLEMETLFVIYGFESQNDFVSNLTRELGIDEVRSKALSLEIDSKIFSAILDKANELSVSEGTETLQNAVEQKLETQEITPRVVVEMGENKPSVNLIQPPVVQAPIELKPKEPTNIVESKLREVVAVPKQTSSYPDGVDPYREPTQ